ncbi:hypothetical protein SELMODRAFT_418247 [Selaginella moellendorffii]|uniref:Uncharacterized protein n=1 Tax=Selaginella moellendorffii TaxID=88036 RepID=D8S548_SELML|nr:hypothetical protein SELMODRAFT_418247 [Selaginella moellendorffii]
MLVLEITAKPVWMYHGVDYILGYAANGFEVHLMAITADLAQKWKLGKSKCWELLKLELDDRRSFPKPLVCIFNFARIIPVFIGLLEAHNVELDQYTVSTRSKVIEVNGYKPVKKAYGSAEASENVIDIYNKMALNEHQCAVSTLVPAETHEAVLQGINIERLVGSHLLTKSKALRIKVIVYSILG